MKRSTTWLLSLGMACGASVIMGACGGGNGAGGDGGGDTGVGDSTTDGGPGDGTMSDVDMLDAQQTFTCDGCTPFPPLGTTVCAPSVLGPSQLVYPTDGLLLPPNMNVLEVQFVPPAGAVEFEVDFENAVTDVRVDTFCNQVPDVRGGPSRGCGLTLPQAAWTDIANANRDGDPLAVTVRATIDGSCVTTSPQTVRLSFAKDDLAGGIYYWQSATYNGIGGETGGIYSHDFGTFDPTPTPFYTSGATGRCIGCHNVSRDGIRMAVANDDPDGDDEFGDVTTFVMDIPTKTKVGGLTMSPGFQTFTHDHSKMIASTYKDNQNRSFDIFDGNGATLLASPALPTNMLGTQPDMAIDDSTLVFVVPGQSMGKTTISMAGDHHFEGGSIYTMTFNGTNNAFGTPQAFLTPSGTQNYYYPSFAPTMDFIIFNEVDDNSTANNLGDGFYNRKARVKVMHYPAQMGDSPLDLTALNVADGLSNSWPRWSPFVGTFHGHQVLWVTFSSNRDYGLHLVNAGFDNCYPPESPSYDQPQPLSKMNTTYKACAEPQIWMAGVIVDSDRTLDSSDRSYPAFWLPFQDVTAHNHSAQWVQTITSTPPPGDGGGACIPSGDPCGDGGAGVCCQVCCYSTCAENCVN